MLSYTASGTLYYGDTYGVISGVSLSAPTGASATAGSHEITVSGGFADNYDITHIKGTLSVSKASLTVTADDKSKTYGGADPVLSYTASGTLYYGDSYGVISGVSLSAPTGAAATAGSHEITASGGVAGNYDITHVKGTLSVTKASLAVIADDKTKVYGDLDPVFTVTYIGFVYEEDASYLGGALVLWRTTGEDAGDYNIMVEPTLSSPNYDIEFVRGNFAISRRSLEITASDTAKVYGTAVTFTGAEFAASGLLNGDTVTSVALQSEGTAVTAEVGSYVIIASGAQGTGLSNYTVSYIDGILIVSKATPSVTIWPSASGIAYGQALSSSTLTGGAGSVSGSFAFTSPAMIPNAGTYSASVTFTPADASNYNVVTGNVDVLVQSQTFTPVIPVPAPEPQPTPDPSPEPEGPYTLSLFSFYGQMTVLVMDSETVELPDGRYAEKVFVPTEYSSAIREDRAKGAIEVEINLARYDKNEPAAIEIEIPYEVLEAAQGMTVMILTDHGSLAFPPELVGTLAAAAKDITMTVYREPAQNLGIPAGTEPLAEALTVLTSVQGSTRITITMDLMLPEDDSLRQARLGMLSVYALHSDGASEVIFDLTHEIDYSQSPPILRSTSFLVDRFNRFVVVEPNQAHLETVVGVAGYTIAGNLRNMVPSYYKGSDTMMPIRMLQDFGVNYTWDQDTSTATMRYFDKTVVLTIGSTDAYINGVRTPIIGASGARMAPELAPGRTMIPLRFVSEHLGFKVTWDPTNLITIRLDTES